MRNLTLSESKNVSSEVSKGSSFVLRGIEVRRDFKLRIDILKEPGEGSTLESFLESKSIRDVSERDESSSRIRIVIKFFVAIHPDFGSASSVPGEDVSGSSREGVRMLFAEDVSNTRARDDFKR